ncbi:MAG: hypothetical protein ABIB71_09555 [Candidatus Woesearchaeota archaeon]
MIEIGKPIEPMLAEYSADINEILKAHGGRTAAELKYDGYRFQLHKKGGIVTAYTRNLNKVHMELFPELKDSIGKLPDCILDCELNAGIGHNGFKKVKKRFRHKVTKKSLEEYFSSGIVEKMPIELKVFDVLYWEDKELINEELNKRRKFTEKVDGARITPGRQWEISSVESLKDLFDSVTNEKHEGLVCKDFSSLYIPKARKWYKLKRFETLDLALLGVYMKDGEISQALCGTYNPETRSYEALCSVNAKRQGLNREIGSMLGEKLMARKPRNIKVSEKMKAQPDFYVMPSSSLVLEVRAMNILRSKNGYACGLEDGESYSLRIGWVYGIREKKPRQATTTAQLARLYEIQEAENDKQ